MDAKKFTIISVSIFILSLLVFISTVILVFFRPIDGNNSSAKKENKKKVETQNVEIGDVSTQIGASGKFYKGFVYLEVKGKKTPAIIEEKMPQIKDSIIYTISYSDISAITSESGMNDLKEKIKIKVNDIIGTQDVVNVLFTQSILQ